MADGTVGRPRLGREWSRDAERLMCAVTMSEIKEVAHQLGLTFNTAYRARADLYRRPPNEWPQVTRLK